MSKTRVTLNDKTWVFDEAELTVSDAFLIKEGTRLNTKPFFEGLTEMDPVSLRGLVWFLRRKDGEHIDIESVDFKLADLQVDQDEDPTAADATSSESAATA